ncbi:MAG TPA: nitrate reductase subunit beta [Myxococcales bacterium]|nr:nitrate reductase subunit beta [Myxococcales bacterium]
MSVRAQMSSVFHLDKCIGCHTCSVACKNQWSDRRGIEYAWWNNVETRPGTGYPVLWEDQDRWRGGWKSEGGKLSLRQGGKAATLAKLFHNPSLPVLNDYYEPWTYRYQDLFDAPAGTDQPTARPVSTIDGKPVEIRSGPNWDDDLGGSPLHAANDPNLAPLAQEERDRLAELEQLAFFYLPRVCNHCVNPACVAACPSGAIYKRAEDGAVLVAQDKCRSFRMCVSACPYKKVFQNWSTGKSEKCIFCYPRLEAGEAPACFHTCVGRIRYLGVLLYDADLLLSVCARPDSGLVEAQRAMILDPRDPGVQARARDAGVSEAQLEAARRSPVYRWVKEWGLALPLHPEYRTLPMLFYVPPLLPVLGGGEDGIFGSPAAARLPIRYLASLFSAGNTSLVETALRRLMAVRAHRRAREVGDVPAAAAASALQESGLTEKQAEEIFRLTSLAPMSERIVVPALGREEQIDGGEEPQPHRGAGFGFLRPLEGR